MHELDENGRGKPLSITLYFLQKYRPYNKEAVFDSELFFMIRLSTP
jgi:hypothetical protein